MQAQFISTQNLYWEVAAVYCHLLEKRLLRKDVGIRCHHQAVRMLDSCAKAKKNFNELFYFLLSPINIFHKIVGDFCLPRLESQGQKHTGA